LQKRKLELAVLCKLSLVAGWTRVGAFDDMEAAENWLASFVSVP